MKYNDQEYILQQRPIYTIIKETTYDKVDEKSKAEEEGIKPHSKMK